MRRRTVLEGFIAIAALPFVSSCSRELVAEKQRSTTIKIDPITVTPLEKLHEEWRALLSPEAYRVLFEEDTEQPGSSPLNKEYRDGTYICAACYLPLFESQHKYDSGTGWPSFTQPISGHVGTKRDFKLIMLRTEYHCARCGGHQGHVFTDGPPPRGERWCNNGLALRFIPKDEPLPELRG
ncbi:peptide-methionine (R)-S-oxide reductase MsrB [Nitrosomonas sp.]|uniref:peptide-methionine (R)-S-oxide reductase MsrB n=1 Tax=Nitrosomonas sp. TaxID=42353 RepID=UPI002634D14C|nr:peptide-methionine (R)-S-oxide reductase MsrB [Nitrosomonas sp.]MCW5602348.1 peptide-methionine (R)-S-oxide reductase MsrB [Nitrosomonas sp.]